MKIYEELDTALKALLSTTSAKTVEEFNDQYHHTETDNAKSYPAIYFEVMDPMTFTQAGNQYQQATTKLRMHCVVYDLLASKTKCVDFAQEVFKKLHQIKLYDASNTELSSELCRVNGSMPKRYKNLKVILIDFECEVFDYSTLPDTTLLPPNSFNVTIPQT